LPPDFPPAEALGLVRSLFVGAIAAAAPKGGRQRRPHRHSRGSRRAGGPTGTRRVELDEH
jgi:hypothetical protein